MVATLSAGGVVGQECESLLRLLIEVNDVAEFYRIFQMGRT